MQLAILKEKKKQTNKKETWSYYRNDGKGPQENIYKGARGYTHASREEEAKVCSHHTRQPGDNWGIVVIGQSHVFTEVPQKNWKKSVAYA